MIVSIYPNREEWESLVERPYKDNKTVIDAVKDILQQVWTNGDDAIKGLTERLDKVKLSSLQVSREELEEAEKRVPEDLRKAILQARANIEAFHRKQVTQAEVVETMPGIRCWRKSVGIEKVGLYIPGGTAPLFSTVLMLAVPAAIAGCKEIILCTPCGRDGSIHPALLFAAGVTGVTRIFKIGGAQAIAAMAYGTDTIPAVYKICGPGNQYVTAAKQLVQMEGVAIDMPAGPSEVCVLADETADPAFIASDLLSQAEHGVDSQVLLVSTDRTIVDKCLQEIDRQVAQLPRKEMAFKALENSKAIVVRDINEAVDLVNAYAAEHLILNCREAEALAGRIINAGSIFIGPYSPESAGDYASGTNHTLPTNGFARAYSGVSVDSFVKKITFQQLSKQGLDTIAETVIAMAEAEGLDAHAQAIRVRL